MKRTVLSFVAAAALLGGPASAFAKGESSGSMTMNDLPQPVQDSVKREEKAANSHQVEEIHKTTDASGNEAYKAEIVSGKRGTELTIAPDGKILDRSSHNEAAERKEGRQ